MAKSTTKKQSDKQKKIKKLTLGVILGILAIFVVFNVTLVTYALQYKDEIYPNTYIGDINLGGKTKSEGEQFLKQKISQFPSTITLKIIGHPDATLNIEQAQLTYNPSKTIDDLYAVGRSQFLSRRVSELVQSLVSRNDRKASYILIEQKLEDDIKKVTDSIGTKAADAQIILNDDNTLTISPAKEGIGITQEMIIQGVHANVANLRATVALHPSIIQPKVTEEQARYAYDQVKSILIHAPLTLKADDTTVQMDTKRLFSWVTYELVAQNTLPTPALSPSPTESFLHIPRALADEKKVLIAKVDPELVKNYIANLAINVDNEPANAELRVIDGQVKVVKGHVDGKKLKLDQATSLVVDYLTKESSGAGETLSLPIDVIAAEVKADTIQSLGINELIGRAETNFKGSPANRVHNITTGASFLNGALVPKDQEFSTVKTLGKVDGSTGYLPELVIKENRTTPEYGGGLCQVSTTLFRSVMNAGLKVTERQNHSYRVSYYEPPVGLDATIYLPRPDLKFLNDTPGYILIQSKIEGTKITFELYGTKDGRTTTISDPIVSDITEPPEPSYTETDTLPKGEVKQIEKAHQGATAVATYTVMRDGKEINRQVFRSRYKPWQARYLVGTKE